MYVTTMTCDTISDCPDDVEEYQCDYLDNRETYSRLLLSD